MFLAGLFGLMLGVVTLDGVTGDQLSAEAVFDANNVRLGEPLILQIDFEGVADMRNLHPPALSKHVDATVWKVDDASAKTDTGRYIRRLVYRVRPRKSGLIVFPPLSFAYEQSRNRGTATCETLPIPVHVKPGQQAALAGVETEEASYAANPDGIVIRTAGELSQDDAFAWRKACAQPSEAAFARFDFPEARLNEAACALRAGNWARALNIYRALEWRTGQTAAIERGICAARACRGDGAAAELPVWRQVLRPVLRYALVGRVAVILGALALLVALVVLCRRLVQVLACLAFLALPQALPAQSIFDELDRQMLRMQQQMQQMMNRGGGQVQSTQIIMNNGKTRTIINNVEQAPFEPVVTLSTDKSDIRVGEPFAFILSIERPKGVTVDVDQIGFSEEYGLVSESRLERLPRGTSSNPSNVVDRLSLKARYDVPLTTDLTVQVRGTVWRGAFGQGFGAESKPHPFTIHPLPTEGQPEGFAGAVGSNFRLVQAIDRPNPATNDVIVVRRTVTYDGIMPTGKNWFSVERKPRTVTWHEYFIADGASAVPPAEVVFYDVETRTYKKARSAACPLRYVSEDAAPQGDVAVDAVARADAPAVKVLKLRFYPSENAPVIGESSGPFGVTESRGAWVRADDGRRAGWVRKEALP